MSTADKLKQFTIGVGNKFNETEFSSFDPSTFGECLYHQGKNSFPLSNSSIQFSNQSSKVHCSIEHSISRNGIKHIENNIALGSPIVRYLLIANKTCGNVQNHLLYILQKYVLIKPLKSIVLIPISLEIFLFNIKNRYRGADIISLYAPVFTTADT